MKMRTGYASTSRSRGAWLSSFYKLWKEVGNHGVIKWAKCAQAEFGVSWKVKVVRRNERQEAAAAAEGMKQRSSNV